MCNLPLLILLAASRTQGFQCRFDSRQLEDSQGNDYTAFTHEERNDYIWTERDKDDNVIVPYYWNPEFSVSDQAKDLIREVLSCVQGNVGCMRFREEQGNRRKQLMISIKNQADTVNLCWGNATNPSPVLGEVNTVPVRNGPQSFRYHKDVQLIMHREPCARELTRYSEYHTTLVHEIFHVFGIVHTAQRPDRDRHITVDFDNIKKEYHAQYEKCSRCQIPFGVPYECTSIMHYPEFGRAIDTTKPTVIAKDPAKCGRFPDPHVEWASLLDWRAVKIKVCGLSWVRENGDAPYPPGKQSLRC